MKNYAEELAYWYFRFNGFFLIDNYIAHPDDRQHLHPNNPHQANSHSDTDLIGIKSPFVNEIVGYPEHQCNILHQLIPEPIISNTPEFIGIICEVKAGRVATINNNNLPNQIRRLGLFQNIDEIIDHLQENHTYQHEGKVIIKIVIKKSPHIIHSWNTITIHQVHDFIVDRFNFYGNMKEGGWDKFSSFVIQFILKRNDIILH